MVLVLRSFSGESVGGVLTVWYEFGIGLLVLL